MKSLFQRLMNLGGRPVAGTVTPRLTLAAFGKHPGWNDHIPGIGVETAALVHVKQAMYVSGIGGRIDAGAWRALEAEKRLEGYDHTFLWLRAGHVVLGRMHTSEDGLRRKEYPMVLCVDGEGVPPEFVLAHCRAELDGLSAACRATTSAEQVAAECRRVEDRLRAGLVSPPSASPPALLPDGARRRFLEHPALGPDRLGLLRALHELGSGGGGAPAHARARHLRLPLATDSRPTALLLWAEFLRCAVPAPTPLLVLTRHETDWLDVIIGEPASDDFFCLQATPKALPLVSDIPYDLTPELKPRLQELETRFLAADSQPFSGTPASAGAGEGPPPAMAAR